MLRLICEEISILKLMGPFFCGPMKEKAFCQSEGNSFESSFFKSFFMLSAEGATFLHKFNEKAFNQVEQISIINFFRD